MLGTAATAMSLLSEVFAVGPGIATAIENFWPKVQSVIGVANGSITGAAADAAVAALQTDIEAHLAHIDAEGAKL
jgi:hypothetical protein